MADRATERRARQALEDLLGGELQEVADFLARVGNVPAPDLSLATIPGILTQVKLDPRLGSRETLGLGLGLDVRTEPPAQAPATEKTPYDGLLEDCRAVPFRSFPKPKTRVENPKACSAYKRAVGRCETLGPDCEGPLDYSHILAKSQGGDDIPETNGLVLCRLHHSLWERSRNGWWRAVGHRLKTIARSKVLRWYGDLPKGDDRPTAAVAA